VLTVALLLIATDHALMGLTMEDRSPAVDLRVALVYATAPSMGRADGHPDAGRIARRRWRDDDGRVSTDPPVVGREEVRRQLRGGATLPG